MASVCLPLVGAILALTICSVDCLTGDATWFDLSVGLTACGTQHHNGEMVAAVPQRFWSHQNPNLDPICRRSARVTNPANGRSVTVRIRDKCGGCRPDDIDLSPAAFQALGVHLDVGRFRVNWDIIQ